MSDWRDKAKPVSEADWKKFAKPAEAIKPYREKSLAVDIQRTNETFAAIPKYLYDNAGDIGGSVGGSMAGAYVGAPLGPVGIVGGGIIGGIGGGTAGKEIDEARGTRDENSAWMNALYSTGEELGGRALASMAKPFVDPLISGAQKMGRKIGIFDEPRSVEDLMMKTDRVDPTESDSVDIRQAQENILGERMLNIYEETGSRAGQGLQARLDKEVMAARNVADTNSSFLKNRKEINNRIKTKLDSPKLIDMSDYQLANDIKGAFTNLYKGYKAELDELQPLRAKYAEQVKIPLKNIEEEIYQQKSLIRQELGDEATGKVYGVLNKYLTKEVDGGVEFKDSVSYSDLIAMRQEIGDVMGRFNPNKDNQSKVAGIVDAYINPIIKSRADDVMMNAKPGSVEEKAFLVQGAYRDLSEKVSKMQNSSFGRKAGLTETKQAIRDKDQEGLEKLVFNSVDSWRETEDILMQLEDGVEIIDTMQNKFRQNIVKESWNKKAGEFSMSGFQKMREKYGDDVIEAVAGDDYLQALKESQLISIGLEQTGRLRAAQPVLRPDQKIFENMRRYVVHPLAGRVGLMSGLMSKGRNLIGLGNANDEQIMKLMTGDKGQRLVERMLSSPLSDPKSYNTYAQVVRELSKMGADVYLLDRKAYMEGVDDILGGIEQVSGGN